MHSGQVWISLNGLNTLWKNLNTSNISQELLNTFFDSECLEYFPSESESLLLKLDLNLYLSEYLPPNLKLNY